ncbi:alanine dehydrogenase, partial [Virgibacillus alimentarius]
DPTFTKHGVVHYTVANIPGAVPRTGTIGLTNVTVPYALQIANKGYKQACLDNPALLKGLNALEGHVTFKGVAESHQLPYDDAEALLKTGINV